MSDSTASKQRLENELALVTKELESLGIRNPEVGKDWIPVAEVAEAGEADENILADRYEDLATRDGIVADLETRFNNIQRALAKFEDGTYGACEVCGEPIETDRLDANPAARTCKAHLESERDLSQ